MCVLERAGHSGEGVRGGLGRRVYQRFSKTTKNAKSASVPAASASGSSVLPQPRCRPSAALGSLRRSDVGHASLSVTLPSGHGAGCTGRTPSLVELCESDITSVDEWITTEALEGNPKRLYRSSVSLQHRLMHKPRVFLAKESTHFQTEGESGKK